LVHIIGEPQTFKGCEWKHRVARWTCATKYGQQARSLGVRERGHFMECSLGGYAMRRARWFEVCIEGLYGTLNRVGGQWGARWRLEWVDLSAWQSWTAFEVSERCRRQRAQQLDLFASSPAFSSDSAGRRFMPATRGVGRSPTDSASALEAQPFGSASIATAVPAASSAFSSDSAVAVAVAA
jgi:hypothetical protein